MHVAMVTVDMSAEQSMDASNGGSLFSALILVPDATKHAGLDAGQFPKTDERQLHQLP